MSLPLALAVSAAFALAGWVTRALTASAAAVATLVGSAIVWRTGVSGMAALGAFFIGASLISRLAPDRSVSELDAKGNRRDPWQVLANGGPAALGALFAPTPNAALWLVAASLGAAAADTWATSTGGWSTVAPRHVLSWSPVPPGTSGGVTLLGTAGALAGAATVALAASLGGGGASLFPPTIGIGMLGMLADSFIGAAWQGRFHCPSCGRATERRVHRCGKRAVLTGGFIWLGNDGVNGFATAFAALAGLAAWRWWGG